MSTDPEDIGMEAIQDEAQKEKIKIKKQNCGFQDNIKQSNICVWEFQKEMGWTEKNI